MNFLKRSLISIFRQPVKTSILFLVVFILGTVISGALSTTGAILNTDANLRRATRPIVAFEIDREIQNTLWTGEVALPDNLTVEMIRQVGALDYVSHFNYYFSSTVGSFLLKNYEPEHFMGGPVTYPEEYASFALRGVAASPLWDVVEETIRIVDGREFTDLEIREGAQVAIVSQGFAQVNNLAVGSVFTVSSSLFDWSTGFNFSEAHLLAQAHYELEIIGIFEIIPQNFPDTATNQQRHQEWSRMNNVANRLYVPNQVAENAEINRYQLIEELDLADNFALFGLPVRGEPEINAIFTLSDPLDLEVFRRAVEPLLPEFWTIVDLTATFASLSATMVTLQELADLILLVATGGTLAILTLVIMLFLRDRRHEIGIYLALGEKKAKIVMQVMFEVVLTSLAGIILAVFVGKLVSQNLSQTLIRTELISESERFQLPSAAMFFDPDDLMWSFGGVGVRELSIDELVTAFDVSLDLATILIFYGGALLVVMFATLLSVVYVIRLNPKKVLL